MVQARRSRERSMIRQFWQQTGGTLVEEYRAVPGTAEQGRRWIDGVIILGEPECILSGRDHHPAVDGRDIVVVQAKATRVGMSLLGQAFFSREIMKRHGPRSIRTVALCTRHDAVLSELAEREGIEVIPISGEPTGRCGASSLDGEEGGLAV